jgi:cell division protein FtsB
MRNPELNHDIDDLENNPAAIEKIAREKYSLVRPAKSSSFFPTNKNFSCPLI